jgi:hypothetical protein
VSSAVWCNWQVWQVIAPYLETKYINNFRAVGAPPSGIYIPVFSRSADMRQWVADWSYFMIRSLPAGKVCEVALPSHASCR